MQDVREPHLKYEGLGGDVSGITSSGDEVTCLCLSDKILAVGTARGNVHVLDYSGNEVRLRDVHDQEQRHTTIGGHQKEGTRMTGRDAWLTAYMHGVMAVPPCLCCIVTGGHGRDRWR